MWAQFTTQGDSCYMEGLARCHANPWMAQEPLHFLEVPTPRHCELRRPYHHISDCEWHRSYCISSKTPLEIALNDSMAKSEWGRLLLHYPCSNAKISTETIAFLINAWPGSIQKCNQYGDLPLHQACKCIPGHDEVMALLIKHWPQVLQIATGNLEHFPLHLVCEKPKVSLSTLQLLVWTWPDAVCSPDKEGFLPLHLACCKLPDGWKQCFSVIDFLVESWPESLQIPTRVCCLCTLLAWTLWHLSKPFAIWSRSIHQQWRCKIGRDNCICIWFANWTIHCTPLNISSMPGWTLSTLPMTMVTIWTTTTSYQAMEILVLSSIKWTKYSLSYTAMMSRTSLFHWASGTNAGITCLWIWLAIHIHIWQGKRSLYWRIEHQQFILHLHIPFTSSHFVRMGMIETLEKIVSQTECGRFHHGMLPLHYACCAGAPLLALKWCLQKFPAAIHHTTLDTKDLPLHCYLSFISTTTNRLNTSDNQKNHNYFWSTVQFLVEQYLAALHHADWQGLLPFHVAALNDVSLDILHYLAQKYPESLQMV